MLLVVVTFSAAVPDVVMDAGEKAACIPSGCPLTLSDTVPVKPLSADMLTENAVLLPATTDSAGGVTESEKPGFRSEVAT